jgi:group I intron endonuclease
MYNKMIGIYKITNPKGKVYIGQSVNIEKRWKAYKRAHPNELRDQRKLLNSLIKYGSENHIFEVLEECLGNVTNEREIFWIEYFNSIKNGLNIREGGTHGRLSEETKQKISKALTGKKQSQETIDKRSKSLTNLKRSDESKANISKGKKGMPLTWGDKIKESKNKNPYVPTEETKLKLRQNNVKPVVQLDLEKNIINEFFSATEAERQTGIKAGSICMCLKGKSKTSGGFIWEYKL